MLLDNLPWLTLSYIFSHWLLAWLKSKSKCSHKAERWRNTFCWLINNKEQELLKSNRNSDNLPLRCLPMTEMFRPTVAAARLSEEHSKSHFSNHASICSIFRAPIPCSDWFLSKPTYNSIFLFLCITYGLETYIPGANMKIRWTWNTVRIL